MSDIGEENPRIIIWEPIPVPERAPAREPEPA